MACAVMMNVFSEVPILTGPYDLIPEEGILNSQSSISKSITKSIHALNFMIPGPGIPNLLPKGQTTYEEIF